MRTSNRFQIGKAGEYLVCADLLLKGLNVSTAGETLPYDILLDTGDMILKIQVKTTETHKISNQWKGVSEAYVFSIKRKGSNGSKKYDFDEVDIFAVVALDTKQIGYIKNKKMPTTINIRVDALKGTYHDEKGIENHKTVNYLKQQGKSITEIMREVGLCETSVRNYLNKKHSTFKTKAIYMSDLQKEKEWFLKYE